MKKKILLILLMFMFTTNVNALTFNVDVTNIEDEGNNGTIGTITNIDIPNKTVDAEFSNIGDEVSFSITISNTGDRAGTLRSIDVTSSNDKIEYTTNLPENGLAINGNDTNKVIVTAKVKQGAVNGTSSSTIKITYNYDEGSCPEGEILSDDESMCLCPEGKVRNELGICVEPPKPIECEEDEIYNSEKKICEKKELPPPVKKDCAEDEEYNQEKDICEKKQIIPGPVEPEKPTPEPTPVPNNPQTLDNIILITLLFFVSGLGIYAAMFKKLDTNKKKVTGGVITGVITLTLSFTVLVSVFGLDNLLGAIVNPITKETYLTINVNETIDMIETWDGYCSKSNLAPEEIFEGGSGTESDPYTIKTADQLACFAKTVTNGRTYANQFVSQIKDIKLNDNLIDTINSGTTDGLHIWTSAGNTSTGRYFAGTYDGNNHTISGLYLTNASTSSGKRGLFSYTKNATLKNMILSDVYMNASSDLNGVLIGTAQETLLLDNITTNGTMGVFRENGGGIIGSFYGSSGVGWIKISNITNNISPTNVGIVSSIYDLASSDEPNVVFKNVVNNGDFKYRGGLALAIRGVSSNPSERPNVLFENVVNNGNRSGNNNGGASYGGLVATMTASNIVLKNTGNTGNILGKSGPGDSGGLIGTLNSYGDVLIDSCYNSGDITFVFDESYLDGITVDEITSLRASHPTGVIGGLIGTTNVPSNKMVTIKDSYNTGTLSGLANMAGLVVYSRDSDTIGGNLTIIDSYNMGDLRVGDGVVAGLAAMTKGTIQNSYNKGDITIWGYRDAYNELSGGSYHTGTSSGTLVGKNNNLTWDSTTTGATIIDSYNEGDVLITAKTNTVNFGGLCGLCNSITNSHNSGNITSKYASQYIDGIGFRIFDTTTDTYFDGEITTENLPY